MNEIASRYALSLYDLGVEKNALIEYQEESKELIKLFKTNSVFMRLLSNAYLSIKEREVIIDKTLVGVSKDIVSLIKVVLRNHREAMLISIFEEFNSLVNEYRGVREGLIYTTELMDEKTKASIEKKIGEIENSKVELHNLIDQNLIGGFKVVINGHIYDSSIKNNLEKMKEKLLRK